VRESNFRAGSTKVIGRSTGTREFAATRIQTAYRSYRVYITNDLNSWIVLEADILTRLFINVSNLVVFNLKVDQIKSC